MCIGLFWCFLGLFSFLLITITGQSYGGEDKTNQREDW